MKEYWSIVCSTIVSQITLYCDKATYSSPDSTHHNHALQSSLSSILLYANNPFATNKVTKPTESQIVI
jgi:hypothetical protein